MASAKRMKRLPGMVLGNDLTLEVGAVAAVSGHGPSSSESPPPVNHKPHSNVGACAGKDGRRWRPRHTRWATALIPPLTKPQHTICASRLNQSHTMKDPLVPHSPP